MLCLAWSADEKITKLEKVSKVWAPTTMAGVLFEDIFDVKDIDPEGKKFDRGNEHLSFTFFIPMCSFFVFWHWLNQLLRFPCACKQIFSISPFYFLF